MFKILTKKHPLYGVKNFITMLVATGTLSLAFVAYLQMIQNEKFRKEEKEKNEKDFNEKKKLIYKIIISKININVSFIQSKPLQDILNDYNTEFSFCLQN
ncbi:MAG: hypothetical protein ACYCT7_02745 [bacterium]